MTKETLLPSFRPLDAPETLSPPLPLDTPKTIPKITQTLPQYLLDEALHTPRVAFDPTQHLALSQPERIYTMSDLSLAGLGIAPTAVSTPFSLFTPAAVAQLRAEKFDARVLARYHVSSNLAQSMVRGAGPRRSPFVHAAWHDPAVLAHVSGIAGVPLVPALDYDVGHVNVSVGCETAVGDGAEDEEAFAWHRDSYPFVCVTMLSDCEGMRGGETALKTGTGEVWKIRGPSMGTAVVMQGRYISHQALKALGGRERISMITSFRPASADARDETVLTGVRAISNVQELYAQYVEYRLEMLEERIRGELKRVRAQMKMGAFRTADAREWLAEQKDFVQAMVVELAFET